MSGPNARSSTGGSPLSRREFVTASGAVAISGLAAWRTLVHRHLEASAGPRDARDPQGPDDRVLVIVQMSGGNDGLNTLVPVGDGRYYDARPTLGVGDADVLPLPGNDRFGLNPGLRGLAAHWDIGDLAFFDAIGLPQQTRSHFAASDVWWSAMPGKQSSTGWIGRWLDRTGDASNPLRAIALGEGAPALRSEHSAATVVLDPAAFNLRVPRGSSSSQVRHAFLTAAGPLAAPELGQSRSALVAALDAVDVLSQARTVTQANAGSAREGARASAGPESLLNRPTTAAAPARPDSITGMLQTAAEIIDLDLGTRVVSVAVGGFDTHAGQATQHRQLLLDLDRGISNFFALMALRDRRDQVVVMTTSEFGRRVHENGGGTDHGNANVQMILGSAIRGAQIVGQADLARLDQGDVAPIIDTRSLYANALDWLSADAGLTDEVLGGSFDRYGILRA